MKEGKREVIEAKIRLIKAKQEDRISKEQEEENKKYKIKKERILKNISKFLNKPITSKNILKPSERIGIVLNIPQKKPTTIGNFFKDEFRNAKEEMYK